MRKHSYRNSIWRNKLFPLPFRKCLLLMYQKMVHSDVKVQSFEHFLEFVVSWWVIKPRLRTIFFRFHDNCRKRVRTNHNERIPRSKISIQATVYRRVYVRRWGNMNKIWASEQARTNWWHRFRFEIRNLREAPLSQIRSRAELDLAKCKSVAAFPISISCMKSMTIDLKKT